MISVLCWRWGNLFSAAYVNRMRAMLARNLRLPHRLYCVTDNPAGLDPQIGVVMMPAEFGKSVRCRRRMRQYDAEFDLMFGKRILSIDLDVVIVGDITPIVDRSEPVVMWRVGYAGVYSGSFVLWDAGALDGAWRAFRADPAGYAKRAQPNGVGSDQAMLNLWLKTQPGIPHWTERDGFVTWFGDGYDKLEHNGMGPGRPNLPPGARLVVLGSADKAVMDEGRYPWVREHWTASPC